MNNAAQRKPHNQNEPLAQSLDDLIRDEAAAKARLVTAGAAFDQLHVRQLNPQPDDTTEWLVELEAKIIKARVSRNKARADYERAVAARKAAEKQSALDILNRERADLEKKTELMVKTKPERVRSLSIALTGEAAEMHFHDQDILDLNRRLCAAGLEELCLPTAESLMRTIPAVPDQEVEEEVERYVPPKEGAAPLQLSGTSQPPKEKIKVKRLVKGTPARQLPLFAEAFEVVGFSPGEPTYRVPRGRRGSSA